MVKSSTKFSSKELGEALGHYDLGKIKKTRPLTAGNRRAPKIIVTSDRGKYLLKRRPSGKDDLYRVAFSHAVQLHLADKGYCVTSIVATEEHENTILQLDHHIYELFEFIEGVRYSGTEKETIDAGKQMAKFHKLVSKFNYDLLKPLRKTFHDSSFVRSHIKTLGSTRRAPIKPMKYISDRLMGLYEKASVRVNQFGFDSWDEQIVHGDWHPGNMLFADDKVAAVLDFDSVKIAPPITDLANAMLQFSLVGGRPNPKDWPGYLNQNKLVWFLKGYKKVISLNKNMITAIIDLMIETIIAEAVLPVATTGFFGNMEGRDFLNMIHRKADWIDKNRGSLAAAMSVIK